LKLLFLLDKTKLRGVRRETMMSTRRHKQALAAASNPLNDAGILEQVCTFLPGHYLFLGAVCKEWEALYAGIKAQQLRSVVCRHNHTSKHVICGTKTTVYSAAVASPATARLAVEFGLEFCSKKSGRSVQIIAGLHADMQTLTSLRELGMPLSGVVVEAVALSGRLLQQLMSEQLCPRPSELSWYAARSGSISMLDWLRSEGWCVFAERTCAGAALAGHIAALQYLRDAGHEWDEEYVAHCAAMGGSIDIVEWLRQQQGMGFGAAALASAACSGQIRMCQHLRNTGCEWDDSACAEAAQGGYLDILRWLRENGCPWIVSEVCRRAARPGHVDILQFVVEQGEVLSATLLTDALNIAAEYDQLHTAQWLRERGAAW
jgi:hypothetical protein